MRFENKGHLKHLRDQTLMILILYFIVVVNQFRDFNLYLNETKSFFIELSIINLIKISDVIIYNI